MTDYEPVDAAEVPEGIVWVTPRDDQGQIVEVSYSRGIPFGKKSVNYEAGNGDPWRRVIDHSDGSMHYAKRKAPGETETGRMKETGSTKNENGHREQP